MTQSSIKSFEDWVHKNHAPLLLHKLQDSSSFRGAKNSVKVPADFVGLHHTTGLLIECKETVGDQVYLSSIIKPHQLAALQEWYLRGGIAGYLIMLWKPKTALWLSVHKVEQFVKITADSKLPKARFPKINLEELIWQSLGS